MDDLSGLDWSATSNNKPAAKIPSIPSGANYYGSMQQTPSPMASGRNTPLSVQNSQNKPTSTPPVASKPLPQKAAADSFSNLMNFGPAKSNANLSLREQQERLEAEKRKKAEEQRRQTEAHYGSQFWDTLGSVSGSGSVSRTASPAIPAPFQQPSTSSVPPNGKLDDDDDLFAAFNADTKVDNASHYPPPPSKKPSPANTLDLSDPSAWGKAPAAAPPANNVFPDDDDDPFGLNQMKGKVPATATTPAQQSPMTADDDFLGDLGRPVEEVRRAQAAAQPRAPEPGKPIEGMDSSSDDDAPPQPVRRKGGNEGDEFDRAVAQLTEYGFSTEDATRAITESGAGLNVQAAANWLLDDAHRRAKAKAEGREPSPSRPIQNRPAGRQAGGQPSGVAGDDIAKTAAAYGNSLFKTANSLWKTGKKQVAQAYADFNQEGGGDPNQPKWMRHAQQGGQTEGPQSENATNEAAMLDSGRRPDRRPSPQSGPSRQAPPRQTSRGPAPDMQSSGPPRSSPVPKWQQSSGPVDPKSRASRLAMDDDTTYVSPNRRRKAAPQPAKEEEPDLLFNTQAPKTELPRRPAAASPQPTQPVKRPSPAPVPKPAPLPTRQIPSISPAAVQQSSKHRLEGTAHFKRGDYAAAHASYSSSLTAVPQSHPLAIIILTNRALTSLKNGEPKKAVEDADAAIGIIGPSGGKGEKIAVAGETGGEEQRDMRELYGKALSRKAEALEQMERWADAGKVWSICVEAGLGGSNAIAGRQRCQKTTKPPAARQSQPPKPKSNTAPPTRPAVKPAPMAPKSSEAVDRLRKQNEAAAAEDDEKFALSEKIDARIANWRDGKRDNLRALLGSLDTVLWEGSGWKKVGLHELVMANKVKIVYMKAIAKCHPDKLPQNATTEMRLIAATVFATLNESWDKFKADNGL